MADRKRRVWAKVDLFVIAESEKGIAFGPDKGGEIAFWLPKSLIDLMQFEDGGDTDDFENRKGERIGGLKLPMWLAESNDLDWEE